ILPDSSKAGTTTATRDGSIMASHTPQPLADEEHQIGPAVAPFLELHLALPNSVRDVLFTEARPVEQCFELDLFAEGHAVRGQTEALEQSATKHPHAGLAVANGLLEQERSRRREHRVPELV